MRFLFSLLLVAAALAPARAQSDPNANVPIIIALEKSWSLAFRYRDRKALDMILDDNLTVVNFDGSLLSKAVFIASVRDSKESDEQQVSPESISVQMFGNVAIATGIFRSKQVVSGRTIITRSRFLDTWLQKNGSWVCVAASATPVLR